MLITWITKTLVDFCYHYKKTMIKHKKVFAFVLIFVTIVQYG